MTPTNAKLLSQAASSRFFYLFPVLLLLANFFLAGFAIPNPEQALVVDQVGILDDKTIAYIKSVNARLKPSGAQIAVAVVANLQGQAVETVANETFRAWGIGDTQKDNGVLLLISMEDRQIRIEIGYGSEGAIPDSVAGRIIRDEMQENFRSGNYKAGVSGAVQEIAKRLAHEYNIDLDTVSLPKNERRKRRFSPLMPLLGLALLYIIRASRKGPRGGSGGSGGSPLMQALMWSLIANNRGGRGGFGGGFSGGSSGGGFGGGSSGGGGASGGW